MKILLAASECAPFSQGAMGEAVGRLARELRALGHDAQVALPLSRLAREQGKPRRTRKKFVVPVGAGLHPCEVWQGETPEGVPVWFLRRDEFFDRSGLYGNESGDYSDNAARFIFFSKAAVELARKLEVDALSAHGWHAALCTVFGKETALTCPVVLTPHGLDFQGNFWSHDFALTNLPGSYFSASGLEFYGSLNFLKGGIVFADAVILPGELFVAAAQTPAHGCGLEKVLAGFAHKLHGIAEPVENGATAKKRSGSSLPLPSADSLAVVFTDAVAGLGLLFKSLDRLVQRGLAVAVFGPLAEADRAGLAVATRKHRNRFLHLEKFEESQAREALHSADWLLMPTPPNPLSPWLPRALNLGLGLIAPRLPGLPAYSMPWPEGAAFFFRPSTPDALSDAAGAALEALSTAGRPAIAAAARKRDFSARAQAEEYVQVFASLKRR